MWQARNPPSPDAARSGSRPARADLVQSSWLGGFGCEGGSHPFSCPGATLHHSSIAWARKARMTTHHRRRVGPAGLEGGRLGFTLQERCDQARYGGAPPAGDDAVDQSDRRTPPFGHVQKREHPLARSNETDCACGASPRPPRIMNKNAPCYGLTPFALWETAGAAPRDAPGDHASPERIVKMYRYDPDFRASRTMFAATDISRKT